MAKRIRKINVAPSERELASKFAGRVVIDNMIALDADAIYELLKSKIGMYLCGRMVLLANTEIINISFNIANINTDRASEGSYRLKSSNTVAASKLIDLVNEKDLQKESQRKRRSLKKTPSIRFIGWKDKNVEKWLPSDFFGYYLEKYLKAFEYEDDTFVGLSDFKRYIRQIRLCFDLHFDGEPAEFKDYIDVMFIWFQTKDCWVKTPGFTILFKSSGNVLMKEYRRIKKGKQKLDGTWSSNDTWRSKINGEKD